MRRLKDFLARMRLKFLRAKVTGKVPRPPDPNVKGKGKTFVVDGGKSVVAERIIGNNANKKKFEITADGEQHTISILEFYCQLEGRRPTEEESADWDDIEILKMETPKKKGLHV